MKAAVLMALLAACTDGFIPRAYEGKAHPIADAGIGSTYPLGATIPLDGTGSFDPDGMIVSYDWRIVTSPMLAPVSISESHAAMTELMTSYVGVYRIQLTVTDDDGLIDTSDVVFMEGP